MTKADPSPHQNDRFARVVAELATRLARFERGALSNFGGQRFEREMETERTALHAQLAELTRPTQGPAPDGFLAPAHQDNQFTHIQLPSGETKLVEIVDEGHGSRSVRLLDLHWNDHTARVLAEAYQLTAAEIEVCRRFLSLCDVKKIAAAQQKSEGTIRQQLKSIFAKTGALNQAQLMRLLGTASARTQQVGGARGWTDPFGRERLFIDVEGRQIALTQMGAPAGKPAILVHGPMTGYVLPDLIEEGLRAHDITLWAISRPGFGNSDPDSHRSALDAGALCIEVVMNHLNIRKCTGIGLICGLAPLARFAAQQPERITSLLGIGSSAPLDKIQSQKALPPLQRVVINLARLSPKALEVVYLQAVLAAMQSDLSSVVRRIYGQCAPDTALLEDNKIMEQLTVGAEMITAQDSRVFLKDLQMMSQPWDKDLERINVPCRMLGGRQDPVFPPHIAAALCADTGTDLKILENAGQLVAFQHPEATLEAIRQAVA